eukprot:TRINITY_DN2318_c0_g2_i1.p2 TRINITY_DN2318_c0_g2~~TRINITY_DN2318_c0_g2_i1.p2  ORF type:complete len:231 (-),score=86.00 TRINITY_DN2318_c0_g2_i1:69-761(-)
MADEVIKQVDELVENKGSPEQVFEALSKAQTEHSDNVEILWRLARAHFDLSDTKADKAFREDHLKKGYEVASKALTIDGNNPFSNKWFAIMTSAMGEFQGQKEKIQNSFKIKEHALKANELKPKDATTLHLLGRWCFSVASLSWLERKAAAALFATPPESTFEEALKYFTEAFEVDPTFRRNLVFLGDTYQQLKNKEKAKEFYQKAIDLPATTAFDQSLVTEAKTKIGKL